MTRVFTLLFALVTPVTAMAQGAVCSEQTIRDAVQNETMKAADDEYFWSGAYDKPLLGKAEHEEARRKKEVEATRKNQVTSPHPQHIDVSKSGDMAYEYGTSELSFDDQKTGKHVASQVGYLRVWKVAAGECKVAATMMRPIESTRKSN
jgi:hypothetical protein